MRKEICDKLCQDNHIDKKDRLCVRWWLGIKHNDKVCGWAVEVEEFIKEKLANAVLGEVQSKKCTCWRCLGLEKDPYDEEE